MRLSGRPPPFSYVLAAATVVDAVAHVAGAVAAGACGDCGGGRDDLLYPLGMFIELNGYGNFVYPLSRSRFGILVLHVVKLKYLWWPFSSIPKRGMLHPCDLYAPVMKHISHQSCKSAMLYCISGHSPFSDDRPH